MRTTAAHEGGHAVAATLLSLPVRLIDTVADSTSLGRVRYFDEGRLLTDPDEIHRRMIVILCGPIVGCESWDEVPSWPLRPWRSTDEKNLDECAKALDMDECGWREVMTDALELASSDEFQRLLRATTGVLGHVPRIGADTLAWLQLITEDR